LQKRERIGDRGRREKGSGVKEDYGEETIVG